MDTITLSRIVHRGQECIGIFSKSTPKLNSIFKGVGAKYSKTHRCWYLSFSKSHYSLLDKMLRGIVLINADGLNKLLESETQDKIVKPLQHIKYNAGDILKAPLKIASKNVLSKENETALHQFRQHLQLKGYSPSTLRTYSNEFIQFLYALKGVPAESMSSSRMKDYLQYCAAKLTLSENTLHSRMNALKFYYEQVLNKEKFFWEIPRPKKHDQLPKVLGENEVGKLFNAITNIKHKAILFTAYSAGLRVSEVVNLKIRDVDSSRMQLFIEKSKGKKDRYVGLGVLLLDILRAYIASCKPRPLKYVFENPDKPGEPYSIRSVQKIFQNAKERAFINKKVGIHSLRHSFATHLLEKGIDIRYIKELLGHFSIKTTERYLHVKRDMLINIPNLLDELNKTFTLEW